MLFWALIKVTKGRIGGILKRFLESGDISKEKRGGDSKSKKFVEE